MPDGSLAWCCPGSGVVAGTESEESGALGAEDARPRPEDTASGKEPGRRPCEGQEAGPRGLSRESSFSQTAGGNPGRGAGLQLCSTANLVPKSRMKTDPCPQRLSDLLPCFGFSSEPVSYVSLIHLLVSGLTAPGECELHKNRDLIIHSCVSKT